METTSIYRRKRKEILCLVLCTYMLGEASLAQDFGPSAKALGGVSTVLVEPWSAGNNPATLGGVTTVNAAVEAHNRFFIPALTEGIAAVHAPLYKGGVGALYRRYGIGAFQQHTIGLACGQSVGEHMAIGTALSYDRFTQGETYPGQGSLTMNVGWLLELEADWRVGLQLNNPLRARWANRLEEVRPTSLQIGAMKAFGTTVSAYTELEKSLDQPLVVACGLAYSVAPVLTLRSGIRTADRSWRFGVAYSRPSWMVEVTQMWSQALGFSSSMACSIVLNRSATVDG